MRLSEKEIAAMVPSSEPTPASNASPRIPELDGVRGLAILLVLVWHYVIYPRYDWLYYYAPNTAVALSLTWSGVDLFFVLSGFLLGGILLEQRSAPHYFKAFYARRFFRILPLYWFSLLVFLACRLWLGGKPAFAWLLAQPLPVWAYASFTQNFVVAQTGAYGANWLSVTWSLAVEEQFYLFLPLLLRWVPLRVLPWLLSALIVSAPAWRWWLFHHHAQPVAATYTLTVCRMDQLLLGVLCAYLLRQPVSGAWLRAKARWLVGGLFILLALLGAGIAIHRLPGIGFAGMAFGSFGLTVYGYSLLALLYSGVLLLVVTQPRSALARVCRWRWLRWLGGIAYAVYLFHQVFNGLCHALLRQQAPRLLDGTDALLTLLALVLTLLTASLTWRWLEKPWLMRGQRVRYE